MRSIDTDAVSKTLRARMINRDAKSISLTNFLTSEQREDLMLAPNADGYGRVHRFQLEAFDDWPANPLPIEPALRALDLEPQPSLEAQLFQSSGCNWRCWYCFVPFRDLTTKRGELVAVSQMVDWDLAEHSGPHAVDLTGGQPDLTPEWPVWFLQELDARGRGDVFVWSDDNLSTDYLWQFLTDRELRYLGEHPRYARACCIKGFDQASFAFNTLAAPSLFDRQFELITRLREETTIDFYVYVTITTDDLSDLDDRMRVFVDRLQAVSEFLPLRCVPLKVLEWGPVTERLTDRKRAALQHQLAAVEAWQREIDARFPGQRPDICDVPR